MFLFVQNYFMTGNNLFMCEYDSRGWDPPPPPFKVFFINSACIYHLNPIIFYKAIYVWSFLGGSVFYGFFMSRHFMVVHKKPRDFE